MLAIYIYMYIYKYRQRRQRDHGGDRGCGPTYNTHTFGGPAVSYETRLIKME